jgi:hypothetical protein
MIFDPEENPKTVYSLHEIEEMGFIIESIIEFKENTKKVYASIKDGDGRRLETFFQKIQ